MQTLQDRLDGASREAKRTGRQQVVEVPRGSVIAKGIRGPGWVSLRGV